MNLGASRAIPCLPQRLRSRRLAPRLRLRRPAERSAFSVSAGYRSRRNRSLITSALFLALDPIRGLSAILVNGVSASVKRSLKDCCHCPQLERTFCLPFVIAFCYLRCVRKCPQQGNQQMARIRSPGYPNASLEQVIEFASKVHSEDRQHPVDRETGRAAHRVYRLVWYVGSGAVGAHAFWSDGEGKEGRTSDYGPRAAYSSPGFTG